MSDKIESLIDRSTVSSVASITDQVEAKIDDSCVIIGTPEINDKIKIIATISAYKTRVKLVTE